MAAQLIISINDAGQLSVSGPVEQTVLCYGMLEVARDVIQKVAQQPQPAIVPPTNGDVLAINRGTGRK